MKKIFSAALVALSLSIAASAQAQTPFFLNKAGAIAEYDTKGPDGSTLTVTRMTVTGINTTDELNYSIAYNVEVFDASRNPMTAPLKMTTNVKNGAVEMSQAVPGMEIEGTMPSYPADMAVGYNQEYSSTVKMMGMSASTSGKERVVARESLTTPAGTFDCFKSEAELTVKTMGQTQNMKTVSWLSPGIGVVKQETRDGAGTLQSTQELVSLK
jgi:hypothetical protein